MTTRSTVPEYRTSKIGSAPVSSSRRTPSADHPAAPSERGGGSIALRDPPARGRRAEPAQFGRRGRQQPAAVATSSPAGHHVDHLDFADGGQQVPVRRGHRTRRQTRPARHPRTPTAPDRPDGAAAPSCRRDRPDRSSPPAPAADRRTPVARPGSAARRRRGHRRRWPAGRCWLASRKPPVAPRLSGPANRRPSSDPEHAIQRRGCPDREAVRVAVGAGWQHARGDDHHRREARRGAHRRTGATDRDRRAAARRAGRPVDGGRDRTINRGHLNRLLQSIGLLQIDSVNVLARAHLLPIFSRLGRIHVSLLERRGLAGSRRRSAADRGLGARRVAGAGRASSRCCDGGRRSSPANRGRGSTGCGREHPGFLDGVLEVIAELGPSSAGDIEKALEAPVVGCRAGGSGRSPRPPASTCSRSARSASPTRRGFERRYDLIERVAAAERRWRRRRRPRRTPSAP